jgi:polysaccharide biosynthesis transport protein
MINTTTTGGGRSRSQGHFAATPPISIEHYLRILLHRKWLVLGTFVVVTGAVVLYTLQLPNVYSAETVIMVDPQKVPESYVRSTVTGDVRGRLGTLSQQILSATRLQKIIDSLDLYAAERKTAAREDVIALMRKQISVGLVADFGGGQDLTAFKIGFTGRDPRQVAQVANNLAALFIDENLKAREQQANGTTEFLQNQLQETRKTLEEQEAKVSAFKLKHIGEMPEQQTVDLQILGQLQSQMQLESESISRAEQQKSVTESLASQAVPVVEMDGGAPPKPMVNTAETEAKGSAPAAKPGDQLKAQLAALLAHGYTDRHPSVKKLKAQIADVEAAAKEAPPELATPEIPVPPTSTHEAVMPNFPPQFRSNNPILQSQLRQLDAEIAKHKVEQQRLGKQIATYQAKLEAIPVREQEIVTLVRDYEISKAHYGGLLDKQLSAETATQLEIRQKGEKFSILDPAQPAERPSSPNRRLINGAGSLAGLGLGVLLALLTELVGMSITTAEQITEYTGMAVLEVIPVIQTYADQQIRRRRLTLATWFGVAAAILVSCAAFLHYYRS